MASYLPLPLFVLLFLVLLPPPCSSWRPADDDDASVSRSVFPMEGDVAWVVQVSDLHISTYSPERAAELALLGTVLRAIRPHLLLVTGDITDAKNQQRTSSRQDEYEWVTYKKTIDAIVGQGGIDKSRIFDIRGNHDTYGVPERGGKLDFFSTYSVNSQFKRLSTISSILLQGDRSYQFLGIDDTMTVGIRFPANIFGHSTDKRTEAVNAELQYWTETNHSNVPVTKVVFGHFPMSFTASSEKGKRYESVFARQSISAYLCGHLHAKVSKQLWRYHEIRTAEDHKSSFWEWELGDWKDSRLMRILAIDGGAVSFIDHTLKQALETSILVTYPTDSRSMNMLDSEKWTMRNDINVLIFSHQVIRNVSARVFDSHSEFKIVEEIPLQLAVSTAAHRPLFHAKWNAENYRSSSATRYWLQVFVVDSHGVKISSEKRPFSVEGKMAIPTSPWTNYLLFEVQWEDMYQVLLWSNLAFTTVLLFIPKLLYHFVRKSSSYQRWAVSILSSPIQQRKASFWLVWFLMEGTSSKPFWFCMVIYVLWLIEMPWFWGYATSENGEIAQMYLSGWSMPVNDGGLMGNKLSNPDVLVITLPFLYLVVVPVIVLTYGLFAEKAIVCLRHRRKIAYSTDSANMHAESSSLLPVAPRALLMKFTDKMVSTMIQFCGSWTRRALLLTCLITAAIHLKLCSKLMSAYGTVPVVLSPPLTWIPLLFLGGAAYCTVLHVD